MAGGCASRAEHQEGLLFPLEPEVIFRVRRTRAPAPPRTAGAAAAAAGPRPRVAQRSGCGRRRLRTGAPGCGGACEPHGRDLSLEAAILDVQEALDASSRPSGPRALAALRRVAGALLSGGGGGGGGGGGAPAEGAPRGSPPQGGGGGADGLCELAAALADVLEGAGVQVAVRAPQQPPCRHGGAGGGAGCYVCAGDAAAAAAAAARGGGRPRKSSFVLRGRFIVIKPLHAAAAGDDGFIIDPCFRGAFQIAPASPGYARVLAALPEAFVGEAAALRRLVALMAAQAERSYAHQGLTPPPWRSHAALLARWFPPEFTDTPATPPPSLLVRLSSDDAARLAAAAAGAAAAAAAARLAGAAGAGRAPRAPAPGAPVLAPLPIRVVRGFDIACARPAAAAGY
ncbi:MAG: hypothetical protein J3K34DRAFT_455683 [Monoraphidium minutum]|nr:MAG: hypothetical protein J3K34DRAFT_455683 [Monoraphidium minutum]